MGRGCGGESMCTALIGTCRQVGPDHFLALLQECPPIILHNLKIIVIFIKNNICSLNKINV